MITPSRLLLGLLAISTSLTFACAAPEGDGDDGAEASEDAVIGGSTTWERPEIGVVLHRGMCTGTLVRPNVVLTAMHCGTGTPVDADVTASDPGYFFEIRKSDTEKHLLKLESDVPAEIAKPARIATLRPMLGSRVAVYGYGCTSRTPGEDGRRPGGGTKRKKEYDWSLELAFGFGDTQNVCPGDSGGPLLDIRRNAVVGTNSGYISGNDRFGDVPASAGKLNELADRWASHR
jgi:hypothetical protein